VGAKRRIQNYYDTMQGKTIGPGNHKPAIFMAVKPSILVRKGGKAGRRGRGERKKQGEEPKKRARACQNRKKKRAWRSLCDWNKEP